MKTSNKLLAEFFGTFWLVFGGCGSAVLASAFFAIEEQTPINLGIGLIGVSLAFSAAGLAPLMALTLWPRARSRDAMFALVVGLGTAELVLIYGDGTVRGLAASAVVGCLASIAAGVLSSLVGGGDRSAGYRFAEAVWRPEGDVIAPDKGA